MAPNPNPTAKLQEPKEKQDEEAKAASTELEEKPEVPVLSVEDGMSIYDLNELPRERS